MPTNTQSTIVAVFRNRSDAEAAASDLKANGFSADDILVTSDTSAVDAAGQPGAEYSDSSARSHHQHEGGIVGWFKSVFGQDEHTDRPYYEDAVTSGHTFLSVDTSRESVERAASVLNSHGPVDVHREAGNESTPVAADPLSKVPPTGAVPGYGAGTAAGSGRAGSATGPGRTGGGDTIPVVQEELQVGKRAVLKGGVRVYSRMVDEPVEETVRLREENVRVDRTPVNREATAMDLRPGKEQVFEVKEYGEEAVVSKQARVVEEVRVHKDASERNETVRDNVRHTEVKVENMGSENPRTAGNTRAAAATATGSAAGTALGANEADFRRHYTSAYGSSGAGYENYEPGYSYGYEMANDPRYQGRSFDEAEGDLRSDYGRRNPNSTWDQTKDAIRYGWDKMTRKV